MAQMTPLWKGPLVCFLNARFSATLFRIEFKTDKLFYVCCAVGFREVWAFYSYHVCYASHGQSIANTGRKLKHLRKNNWFIKTIATTKSTIKSFKMKFLTHFSFIVFKTYLCIVFCQKLQIEKITLITFWSHWNIWWQCRDIRLVLVRWVTFKLVNILVSANIQFNQHS